MGPDRAFTCTPHVLQQTGLPFSDTTTTVSSTVQLLTALCPNIVRSSRYQPQRPLAQVSRCGASAKNLFPLNRTQLTTAERNFSRTLYMYNVYSLPRIGPEGATQSSEA